MTGGLEGQEEEGAVKTIIVFNQVEPIFKMIIMHELRFLFFFFNLLEGEQCQGLIAAALPASTSANYPLSALVRHHG